MAWGVLRWKLIAMEGQLIKRHLKSTEIYPYVKGKCRVCRGGLPPKRRTFCSDECVEKLKRETDWKRIRESVFDRDGGSCCVCQKDLDKEGYNSFHVDHIVPLAKGGEPYCLDNLQLLCPTCNLKKGDKVVGDVKKKSPIFTID